jgi:hypothetical protein
VTIAHKTAITEASSHVSVVGGFISFSVYIAYVSFNRLAAEKSPMHSMQLWRVSR